MEVCSEDSSSDDEAEFDPEADVDRDDSRAAQTCNFKDLCNTALAADRYAVSNRAAAALINAYQEDMGCLTTETTVDPKKLWRARDRARKKATRDADDLLRRGLTSLYFDGRKDKTATGNPTISETEEHVVVLSEPGGVYIAHVTPRSGKAIDLAAELHAISQRYDGSGGGGDVDKDGGGPDSGPVR